jgi:glucosyl-3-phosphoglycerate synthase
LAGEFAATGELVSKLRVQRSWGLEIGTLGDAYEHAGFEGTAQVDLGAYEHDHRAVSGPAGLSEMSSAVGDALFRVITEHGVAPDYTTLAERYRSVAATFVDQYAVDAAYNGLEYDPNDERDQITAYSETISEPGVDTRLPAWCEAPITPAAVAEAAAADLGAATAELHTVTPRSTDEPTDTTTRQ